MWKDTKELLRLCRLAIRNIVIDDPMIVGSGACHVFHGRVANEVDFVCKWARIQPDKMNTASISSRRYLKSYHVEANFYEKLASALRRENIRIPKPLLVNRHNWMEELEEKEQKTEEIIICTKYVKGRSNVSIYDVEPILEWFASFHAAYWGERAADEIVQNVGLWELGSYWHLDTRPEEHEALPDDTDCWRGRLKRAARPLDRRLKRDQMQCLIHGDAIYTNIMVKDGVATFCDFQYCGKGPPTRDLAHVIASSILPNDQEKAMEYYLYHLTRRLPTGTVPPTVDDLLASLDIAYCDLFRYRAFLWKGWEDDEFKCGNGWGSGAKSRVKDVLFRLDGGTNLGSEEAYDEAILREYG